MDAKYKYGLIGALVVAFVAFQIYSLTSSDDETPVAPAPSARPEVTLAPEPSAAPVPDPSYAPEPLAIDPDLDGDGKVTADEVVRAHGLDPDSGVDFDPSELPVGDNEIRFDTTLVDRTAKAMGTWSYEDENPNSWTDAIAALSTEEYGSSMRTQYPLTAVIVSDWDRNFVKPRGVTRVRNVDSKLVAGAETSGWLRFRVEYPIQVKYAKPGAAPIKAKANEWTKLNTAAYQFEYTVEDGAWKLNTIDATTPTKPTTSYGDQDH